jgi:hypothetical protein
MHALPSEMRWSTSEIATFRAWTNICPTTCFATSYTLKELRARHGAQQIRVLPDTPRPARRLPGTFVNERQDDENAHDGLHSLKSQGMSGIHCTRANEAAPTRALG